MFSSEERKGAGKSMLCQRIDIQDVFGGAPTQVDVVSVGFVNKGVVMILFISCTF